MANAYVEASNPLHRATARFSVTRRRIVTDTNGALGGGILVAVSLLCGEAVKRAHFGVPSNALAILATLVLLWSGVVKPQTVDRAATFLVRHMTVFFAPLLLGVATAWAAIAPHAVAFGVAWLVSAFAGLAAAGLCAQWAARSEPQRPANEARP